MVAPQLMTRLFDLTIEATEEAIVNAMVAATTLTGHNGITAHAIDHNLLRQALDPTRSANSRRPMTEQTPLGRSNACTGHLGTVGIVFMVVAAAAPLTVIGGNMPLAMGLGNGAGAPVGFLIAALVLLVFSIGFVTMTPHVPEAGAFFSYVTVGPRQAHGQGHRGGRADRLHRDTGRHLRLHRLGDRRHRCASTAARKSLGLSTRSRSWRSSPCWVTATST